MHCLPYLALTLFSLGLPRGARPATSTIDEIALEEYEVVLNLGSFSALEERSISGSGQIKRAWSGSLADTPVVLRFVVLPGDFGLQDAQEVVELLEDNQVEESPGWSFDLSEPLEGIYGWTLNGWFAAHSSAAGVDRVVVSGVLSDKSYFVEILPSAKASEGFLEAARAFAKDGVRYTGETRDAEWSEEELEQRWDDIAPDRVKEQGDLGVYRTKHYVILTNMRANGGTVKKFGKLMERRYEEIRDIYPFEDIPGGRLLPIYLFQTPQQYHAFLVKVLKMTPQQAERTAGIASQDFYSTSYKAPNDPVHKHEAVHQIFRNVLRLNGGGSWFQEGVAEYAEGKKNDRKPFRNVVKQEKNMPLAEFFLLRSLIFSQDVDKKSGDRAGDSYLQAACLIEYLAQAKPLKAKFEEFVHAIGDVPRNDLPGIEGVIQDLYGQSLSEFEEGFLAYWRKR